MAGGWMSTWRWGQYSGALVFSVGIPVVGAIAEKVGGWVIPLVILYILFATSLGLFVLSFLERSPIFIIRCLYYLVCVGVTLEFFSSMSKIDSEALYLWTPLCTMIGIFVGLGLSQCWSVIPSWASFRRSATLYITRVLGFAIRILGSEDAHPILPQHQDYMLLPPAAQPSTPFPTSSPRLSEETSPPLPSTNEYQQAFGRPEPPEYNPWAGQR